MLRPQAMKARYGSDYRNHAPPESAAAGWALVSASHSPSPRRNAQAQAEAQAEGRKSLLKTTGLWAPKEAAEDAEGLQGIEALQASQWAPKSSPRRSQSPLLAEALQASQWAPKSSPRRSQSLLTAAWRKSPLADSVGSASSSTAAAAAAAVGAAALGGGNIGMPPALRRLSTLGGGTIGMPPALRRLSTIDVPSDKRAHFNSLAQRLTDLEEEKNARLAAAQGMQNLAQHLSEDRHSLTPPSPPPSTSTPTMPDPVPMMRAASAPEASEIAAAAAAAGEGRAAAAAAIAAAARPSEFFGSDIVGSNSLSLGASVGGYSATQDASASSPPFNAGFSMPLGGFQTSPALLRTDLALDAQDLRGLDLPINTFSCTVGLKVSQAQYYIKSRQAVGALLKDLSLLALHAAQEANFEDEEEFDTRTPLPPDRSNRH
ncbi:hypothetical protein JKP88DRAFT_274796 [Tribonema minus]|uniref:Uncharacterized protein n=1 Tax=Tribonema minus TaxID=303371 RepID=A0A836CNA9_9STRA|nr:hypothetical protein JKP88DRAFT_274796 [Tribonema minus]